MVSVRLGYLLSKLYAAIDIEFDKNLNRKCNFIFIHSDDTKSVGDCTICYFFRDDMAHLCMDGGYGVDSFSRCQLPNEITIYKPMSLYLSCVLLKYKKSRLEKLQNLECEEFNSSQ